MKGSSTLIFFVFLGFTSLQAQSFFDTRIEGRVYSESGDVAATHVLNITAQRATITDDNGFFSISAKLNDTLVFSAVQFKRKEVLVTARILDSKLLLVPLEESLTQLDEVVVRPYNLSGDMALDMGSINTESVVTASTLGLPNAYVKKLTQSERLLREATGIMGSGNTSGMGAGGAITFHPLINAITGRTKMLKNRVKRDNRYARTQRVQDFYPDSLFVSDLGIPEDRIADFMHYCEVDPVFQATVDTHDRLKIWEYMRRRGRLYRKNNGLE